MSLSGVWAASVTPLTPTLGIDHGRFATHVQWLLDNGCDGVAVFGSTGEANSFSVSERTEAVDALAAAGIEMDRIVVGAGACALRDAVALSAQAVERGCAAVLVTPPFYYKGVSDDGIFAFFSGLISGVGAGTLRIVLYHFPRLVAVGFSEELIARLVERWPAEIAALKDSSGDVERMKRLVARHSSLAVLAGNEKLLLEVLEAGGAGCLTASANLTSRLAARVYRGRATSDQVRLTAFREALSGAPFVPGLKLLMAEASGDEGWLAIRPPLEGLTDEAGRAFVEAVGEVGVVPNFG